VRDARNGQAFLDEASRVLGAPCVCLTGTEEAAASYRGATDDLPASSVRRLVLDIGGGSTELIVEGPSGLESTSLQLGCVRNTERFLHSDPPTQDELQALADHAHALLDEGLAALPSLAGGGPIEVVGLAGTVASLVMVDRGLRAYDRSVVHHARLDRADVARWTDALAAVPAAERHARFGVEVGRADVLVGGLVVLGAVMDRVGATSLLHSEADILDGVAAGLAEEVRS
jgi:exopolyphosphatase/guanosine-5'-triphosphate,3'-diphosphate pyrophosphatase